MARKRRLSARNFVPDSDSSESKLDPPKERPQPSVGTGPDCRARRMGSIEGFGECLVSRARHCPCGLDYGNSRLCHHPQWELIIARTEAATGRLLSTVEASKNAPPAKAKGWEENGLGL